jgi:hypothetical protein
MPEVTPNYQDSNSSEYDSILRPIQRDLAEQGVDVSPEQASDLFMQKLIFKGKCLIQRNLLTEQCIDVSPDEAFALWKLRVMRLIMEGTGTTDPHDAQ